jgi:hypothetical protein
MLPAATFEMKKKSFNPFPGEAGRERETILRIYKLFIYGDIHDITRLFCKNVLCCELHVL